MSDTSPQRRTNDGKITTSAATTTGAGASLAIGFTDWFFQCYQHGHWAWVAPNQQLIEMGAPILLLPVGLWFFRVLSIIGDIITHRLQKADGN